MSLSQTPTYNIKVVLNRTGIAADTLRAWERRYGLPSPERTQGGHRLYSERDIATIKWLLTKQEEGLSISRAVDLWNEQIASGSDPLADSASLSFGIPTQVSSSDSTLDTFREQWIEACTDFNEADAEQVLNQAFSLFPVENVCVDVLQKGMSQIGELWYENRASVQQEHFASGLAMRRLDALLSAAPPVTKSKTILIGCPPNEWHTFTPLLLALLLRRRGWNVIYLGANVPAQRFAETVAEVNADLVVLVAQLLTTAATLQFTSLALSNKNVPVAFGGRIFNLHPSLMDSVAGTFLGKDVSSAVIEIETVLKKKTKQNEPQPASNAYNTAHQAYNSRRAQIELLMRQKLEPLAISTEDINTGMLFLGDNITAALQLGDMSYVSTEVDWLKTLLRAYETPPHQLIEFMETYSSAVDKNINGQGKPISDWFASEIQKLKV